MSLHCLEGGIGAGKTFCAVNHFMPDYWLNTSRPMAVSLPVNWDYYFPWLTSKASRIAAFKQRLHVLPSSVGEKGEVDVDGQIELHDKLGEFWFFTKPNSVVWVDEVADIWNAQRHKVRPQTLQTYINHHRHYKDDLWFFLQKKEDVDVQVRRKIQYVYQVRNSKYENIWNHPLTRGLRWPVQFFIVRQFIGSDVLESPRMAEVQFRWNVWPSARKFKNYQSFSAAGTLPGKAVPGEDAQSDDFTKGVWPAFRLFMSRAWVPLGLLAGVVVGGFAVKRAYGSYMDLTVSRSTIYNPVTNNVEAVTNESGTTNKVDVVEVQGGERVLLATPRFLVIAGREYRPGDRLGTNILGRIRPDGITLGGKFRRWRDVVLPGQVGFGG